MSKEAGRMTGRYEIEQDEVGGGFTITRFGADGEPRLFARPLSAEGAPVTTFDALRAWICEAERDEVFSDLVEGEWVRRPDLIEKLMGDVDRMEAGGMTADRQRPSEGWREMYKALERCCADDDSKHGFGMGLSPDVRDAVESALAKARGEETP